MKVVQRGIMKILPGKMAEAMELMPAHMAKMDAIVESHEAEMYVPMP